MHRLHTTGTHCRNRKAVTPSFSSSSCSSPPGDSLHATPTGKPAPRTHWWRVVSAPRSPWWHSYFPLGELTRSELFLQPTKFGVHQRWRMSARRPSPWSQSFPRGGKNHLKTHPVEWWVALTLADLHSNSEEGPQSDGEEGVHS